jgi:Xaa-Pro dipeptidase
MTEEAELISRIQQALRESKVPAWLFYGFHRVDPIAIRILQLESNRQLGTRRWFYLVPAEGVPGKLVHRIESTILDHLPGRKEIYLAWQELHSGLRKLLGECDRVAMQYSENASIPYVSSVDGGTVDLVRSCGVSLVSSGDLLQRFESVWSELQLEQHRTAAGILTRAVKDAFEQAARQISSRGETSEVRIQQFILQRFREEGLLTSHSPIVAVNENSADPHYQSSEEHYSMIRQGDFLLIDLWAKLAHQDSVYADITWTGFFGETPSERIREVFEVVRQSRDRGIDFLQQRFESGSPAHGWEVDEAVREVVRKAGYEEFFVHRSGHNLGRDLHGNGVHFDNLETHDTRLVIPGVCCTIEPGIYMPGEFGVRSEINVYMGEQGPQVTTSPQEELLLFPIG